MPKYSTEIRSVYDKPYVKVFLANNDDLQSVQHRLELLQSVRRVNVSNDNKDLTIYAKAPFSAEDVEKQVKNVLEVFFSASGVTNSTINDTQEIRNALPVNSKARKCYEDAVSKMINGIYDRNSLDDIRLALELQLKELLGNNKPLEDQNKPLKDFLISKKMSEELINVHTQALFNLCNFFNNHAKHDYNVKREEVDMAIGYANQIMKVFK